jgi:hypothetical protein
MKERKTATKMFAGSYQQASKKSTFRFYCMPEEVAYPPFNRYARTQ